MNSRRQEYRAAPERPYLRATLHAPARAPVEGYVVDLSARGAGIVLANTELPELARGTRIELSIDALVLPEPIRLQARVRRWVKGEDVLHCGVEFDNADSLEDRIPVALREEFNRREYPRIPIAERVIVLVERSVDHEFVRGVLTDVSIGGVKLLMDPDDIERAAAWRRLWVTFVLPGDTEELRMGAIVRSIDGARLGVEFDPVRTREFESKRVALQDFVEQQHERQLQG